MRIYLILSFTHTHYASLATCHVCHIKPLQIQVLIKLRMPGTGAKLNIMESKYVYDIHHPYVPTLVWFKVYVCLSVAGPIFHCEIHQALNVACLSVVNSFHSHLFMVLFKRRTSKEIFHWTSSLFFVAFGFIVVLLVVFHLYS